MRICYMDSGYYSLDGVIHRGRPPDALSNYFILTMDKSTYGYCIKNGIKVSWLSTYLGFRSSSTLYNMYIRYFNNGCADDVLLSYLLRGCVFPSNIVHCFIINNSFCWFTVENSKVNILGQRVFSQPQSICSCGDFIRRLNYDIVSLGYNIVDMKFYTWGETYWKLMIRNIKQLEDIIWQVKNLNGLDFRTICSHLSNKSEVSVYDAETLVAGLGNMKLRHDKNGYLQLPHFFYKDYSDCKWLDKSNGKYEYGLIIDCEGMASGVLNDGCRELGGILYATKGDIMISEYTFIADERLLEETLNRVIEMYKGYSSINRRGINTYVFGKSDMIMLNSSIDRFKTKGRIKSCLRFIDSMNLIREYLGDDFNMKGSLSNIAKYFGVSSIKPKHNALCDARTLFNILSHIRKVGNYGR